MKSLSTDSSMISEPSTSAVPESSTPVLSNSSLPDPLAAVKTSTKEDDMINLLSLSLAPQSSSPLAPTTLTLTSFSPSNKNPSLTTPLGNSYAVSWAPPNPQETLNKTSSPITTPVNQGDSLPMPLAPQVQLHLQPQESDVTSYPPPPWEIDTPADVSSMPAPTSAVQNTVNSPSNSMIPVPQLGSVGLRPSVPGAQPRPSYVSSNTFFGDLVDLRNADGTLRTTGGVTASTGSPSYSMNSGRK